jgi:hypothetical protein
VGRGVPFDVAFSADDDLRIAWCIIVGELDGRGKFNFLTRRFDEKAK